MLGSPNYLSFVMASARTPHSASLQGGRWREAGPARFGEDCFGRAAPSQGWCGSTGFVRLAEAGLGFANTQRLPLVRVGLEAVDLLRAARVRLGEAVRLDGDALAFEQAEDAGLLDAEGD